MSFTFIKIKICNWDTAEQYRFYELGLTFFKLGLREFKKSAPQLYNKMDKDAKESGNLATFRNELDLFTEFYDVTNVHIKDYFQS